MGKGIITTDVCIVKNLGNSVVLIINAMLLLFKEVIIYTWRKVMRRIKVYSDIDLDCGYQLNKLEDAIEIFDINRGNYESNEILEIYNIIKYIDKELYLPSWNEEFIKKLKALNKVFKSIVGKFVSELNYEKYKYQI